MVLAAQVGASAWAGAQLRSGEAVGTVVGLEAGDASVFNVGDEQAASATIVGRATDTNFPGRIRKAHIL